MMTSIQSPEEKAPVEWKKHEELRFVKDLLSSSGVFELIGTAVLEEVKKKHAGGEAQPLHPHQILAELKRAKKEGCLKQMLETAVQVSQMVPTLERSLDHMKGGSGEGVCVAKEGAAGVVETGHGGASGRSDEVPGGNDADTMSTFRVDKFSDTEKGIFEGTYEQLSEYMSGVEGALGLPAHNIYAGMKMEFCDLDGYDKRFKPANAAEETTPELEYAHVVCEPREACRNKNRKAHDRLRVPLKCFLLATCAKPRVDDSKPGVDDSQSRVDSSKSRTEDNSAEDTKILKESQKDEQSEDTKNNSEDGQKCQEGCLCQCRVPVERYDQEFDTELEVQGVADRAEEDVGERLQDITEGSKQTWDVVRAILLRRVKVSSRVLHANKNWLSSNTDSVRAGQEAGLTRSFLKAASEEHECLKELAESTESELKELQKDMGRIMNAGKDQAGLVDYRKWEKELCEPQGERALSKEVLDALVRSMREHLRKAELTEEEVVALRLYTGPAYMKINTTLRARRPKAAGSTENTFVCTVFAAISGMSKLAELSPIPDGRRVYRGYSNMKLPEMFWEENVQGVRGGVELGFCSTTTEVEVATQYATQQGCGRLATVFEIQVGAVDKGASIGFLSQYPHEDEILMPPRSFLEVVGQPTIEVKQLRRSESEAAREVSILKIPVKINCNLQCPRLEKIQGSRKTMILSTLQHVAREIERDLAFEEKTPEFQQRKARDRAWKFYKEEGPKFLGSIRREVSEHLAFYESKAAGWFNTNICFRRSMHDTLELHRRAMGKLQLWMEDETLDVKFFNNNKVSALDADRIAAGRYRRMIAEAEAEYRDGDKREKAIALCKHTELIHQTVDEVIREDIVQDEEERTAFWQPRAEGKVTGETALMANALNGNEGAVRLLLEAQASVAIQKVDGRTALMLAAECGQHRIVRLLLEWKADAEKAMKDGRTALILAAQGGHERSVGELLRGYKAEAEGGSAPEEAEKRDEGGAGARERRRVKTGLHSAMHEAAKNGHTGVVKALVRKGGASIEDVGPDNRTPLMSAARNGHRDVVKWLVKAGAMVEPKTRAWSPLIKAAQMGHSEIVRYLGKARGEARETRSGVAERGVVEGCWNEEEMTAAMQAARHARLECLKVLRELKADMNATDKVGFSVLMYALKQAPPANAEELVARAKLTTPAEAQFTDRGPGSPVRKWNMQDSIIIRATSSSALARAGSIKHDDGKLDERKEAIKWLLDPGLGGVSIFLRERVGTEHGSPLPSSPSRDASVSRTASDDGKTAKAVDLAKVTALMLAAGNGDAYAVCEILIACCRRHPWGDSVDAPSPACSQAPEDEEVAKVLRRSAVALETGAIDGAAVSAASVSSAEGGGAAEGNQAATTAASGTGDGGETTGAEAVPPELQELGEKLFGLLTDEKRLTDEQLGRTRRLVLEQSRTGGGKLWRASHCAWFHGARMLAWLLAAFEIEWRGSDAEPRDDTAGTASVASETRARDAPGGCDVEAHQERERTPRNSEKDWRRHLQRVHARLKEVEGAVEGWEQLELRTLVGSPWLATINEERATVSFAGFSVVRYRVPCRSYRLRVKEAVLKPRFGFATSSCEEVKAYSSTFIGADAHSWVLTESSLRHNGTDERPTREWNMKAGDLVVMEWDVDAQSRGHGQSGELRWNVFRESKLELRATRRVENLGTQVHVHPVFGAKLGKVEYTFEKLQ